MFNEATTQAVFTVIHADNFAATYEKLIASQTLEARNVLRKAEASFINKKPNGGLDITETSKALTEHRAKNIELFGVLICSEEFDPNGVDGPYQNSIAQALARKNDSKWLRAFLSKFDQGQVCFTRTNQSYRSQSPVYTPLEFAAMDGMADHTALIVHYMSAHNQLTPRLFTNVVELAEANGHRHVSIMLRAKEASLVFSASRSIVSLASFSAENDCAL